MKQSKSKAQFLQGYGHLVLFFAIVASCLCATGCRKESSSRDLGRKATNVVVSADEDVEVVVTTNIVKRSLTREPLAPESTKRLADGPQEITLTFQASGRGAWADKGKEVVGSFFYTSLVRARSEIISSEETALGNIRVVENRKFIQTKDSLTFSDMNAALALDTLPIAEVYNVVQGIAAVIGYFDPTTGMGAKVASDIAMSKVKLLDGASLRGLLKYTSVEVPQNIEDYVNEFVAEYASKSRTDMKLLVHSLEGKTYKITYLQTKEGAPLQVDFTNVDGSQIPDDEWDILKLANVFLDAQVIPDKRVQVGGKWKIDAEDFADLLGPVADGKCSGKLEVTRKDDETNGDWNLSIGAGRVTCVSDMGNTTGEVVVKEGVALGDSKNAFVKSLELVGSGRLKAQKSKRHFLLTFLTRTEGDCEFRTLLATDRKE